MRSLRNYFSEKKNTETENEKPTYSNMWSNSLLDKHFSKLRKINKTIFFRTRIFFHSQPTKFFRWEQYPEIIGFQNKTPTAPATYNSISSPYFSPQALWPSGGKLFLLFFDLYAAPYPPCLTHLPSSLLSFSPWLFIKFNSQLVGREPVAPRSSYIPHSRQKSLDSLLMKFI